MANAQLVQRAIEERAKEAQTYHTETVIGADGKCIFVVRDIEDNNIGLQFRQNRDSDATKHLTMNRENWRALIEIMEAGMNALQLSDQENGLPYTMVWSLGKNMLVTVDPAFPGRMNIRQTFMKGDEVKFMKKGIVLSIYELSHLIVLSPMLDALLLAPRKNVIKSAVVLDDDDDFECSQVQLPIHIPLLTKSTIVDEGFKRSHETSESGKTTKSAKRA